MRDNAQSGPNGILLYHYAHKTCSDCGIHLLKSAKNQILVHRFSRYCNDCYEKHTLSYVLKSAIIENIIKIIDIEYQNIPQTPLQIHRFILRIPEFLYIPHIFELYA